jgi:hypothetical protein
MQIVAATLPFPWAAVYDGRYTDPVPRDKLDDIAQVRPDRFWGSRFHIARTVDMQCDGTLPPARPRGAPVRAQLCLNPHLDTELNVHVLEAQKRAFQESGADLVEPTIARTAHSASSCRARRPGSTCSTCSATRPRPRP